MHSVAQWPVSLLVRQWCEDSFAMTFKLTRTRASTRGSHLPSQSLLYLRMGDLFKDVLKVENWLDGCCCISDYTWMALKKTDPWTNMCCNMMYGSWMKVKETMTAKVRNNNNNNSEYNAEQKYRKHKCLWCSSGFSVKVSLSGNKKRVFWYLLGTWN